MAALSEVGLNPDALADHLGEFTEHLEEFKDELREERRLFSRRTMRDLGDQGEDFVLSQLRSFYTQDGDVFTPWGETGHQADIQCLVAGSPSRAALIEVKNHGGTVPKNEIERFLQDLRAHPNMLGGVFVSLRSKIPGQRTPMDIQTIDGRPVLFVMQNEPSEQLFVVAWGVLRELLDRQAGLPDSDPAALIARLSAKRLRLELREFERGVQQDVDLVGALKRSIDNVSDGLVDVRRKIDGLEGSIGLRARALVRFLTLEAATLEEGSRQLVERFPWSQREWVQALVEAGGDPSVFGTRYERLYRILQEYDGLTLERYRNCVRVCRNDLHCFDVEPRKRQMRVVINSDLLSEEESKRYTWDRGELGRLSYSSGARNQLHHGLLQHILDACDD